MAEWLGTALQKLVHRFESVQGLHLNRKMKQVISSQNKPIKLWLDDLEQGALDQAKNLANLPFAFKHVSKHLLGGFDTSPSHI